ncbi:hypothetical protein NliqN6_3953 [Naganishia liquefaciens]|uniref:Uncharacterized protein n=1 Tax=Naganishia liquefaciens TaxID=104408 RepID=A0A8H3YHE0_9TREE|nr:hypothetical protein NliqN6_3953 [Naganishia liquefaciens]
MPHPPLEVPETTGAQCPSLSVDEEQAKSDMTSVHLRIRRSSEGPGSAEGMPRTLTSARPSDPALNAMTPTPMMQSPLRGVPYTLQALA